MIRGIHHTALATPNLERMLAFYCDSLGFEQVYETSWKDRPVIDKLIGYEKSEAKQAMIKAGNTFLELFEYTSPAPEAGPERPSPSRHGYTHFCLDVVDIEAEYDRLSKAGMTFHGPLPTHEEMGFGAIRAIYGRDPDGNIIEIQEVIDPEHPTYLEV